MIDDCYETICTVPIDSSGQVFHLQTPYGSGNVTLNNALALRAVSRSDPQTPQPGTSAIVDGSEVPKFTFLVYDHFGNSHILYPIQLVDCNPDRSKHVLDYYPYGRTLREHAVAWERFQTTHYERDPETGLDYRGARFYDGDVGRFLSVDPLAADYAAWACYNYVWGNSTNIVDPSGMEPELTGTSAAYGSYLEQIEKGPATINVHIVNSAKLKDNSLKQIYKHIVNIYDDNGFAETTFNFHTYSEDQGKKIGILDYKELFLALVNSTDFDYRLPGLSTPSSVGRTSAFDKNRSVFESYVNVNVIKSWGPRDLNWAVGLLASHELLHQLDFQSNYYFNNRHIKSNHIDSDKNLLQTGYWLQNYACKSYRKCDSNHLIHSDLVQRITQVINH